MESRDASGKTPLITVCGTKASSCTVLHAAKGKHVKIVELLLKADKLAQYRKHAVANTSSKQVSAGKTGLMFAAASKRVEMVSLMLSHGADPLAEDEKGTIEAAASKANGGGGKRGR